MSKADFTIKSLDGVGAVLEGRIVEILATDVQENRTTFGLDWSFDLVRIECDRVHHGLTEVTIEALVYTGVGGNRLLDLKPGPTVACLYVPVDIKGMGTTGKVRIACLMDPERQSLPQLLSLLKRAA